MRSLLSLSYVAELLLLSVLAVVFGLLVTMAPWYLGLALIVAPFGLFFVLRWPERVLWVYMVVLPLSHGVFVLTLHQGEVPIWREAMLVAVALGMMVRIYWRRWVFGRGILPLGMFIAFFVILLLSGWDSDTAQYRAGARALLPSLLVLMAASSLDVDARTARRILLTVFWLGVVESVVGIFLALLPIERLLELGFEYAVQVREVGTLLRAFGTFRDPFSFAHFTMVCLIGMLAARKIMREALPPPLLHAGIGIIAAGAVMSFVRDALVGAAVGIAVCEIARRRFAWPVLGTVGLVSLAMAALMVTPTDDLAVLRWDAAVQSRFEVWTDLMVAVEDNPLGRGLGTVGAAAERALEDQGHTTREYDAEGEYVLYYDPVDSQYVLFLLIGGVTALGAFWGAVGFLVWWVHRYASHLDSPWTESFVVGLLGMLASLLVTGITRNILEEYPTGVYIWLIVGLLIATVRTAMDAHDAAGSRRAAAWPWGRVSADDQPLAAEPDAPEAAISPRPTYAVVAAGPSEAHDARPELGRRR